MANISEMKDYLTEKGVKPSYPRLKILEYLIKHHNHPTADDIYSELVKEMPTLSKTTVYNTLKLFVDEDVAIPISIDGNETRYDATVDTHGHFKCGQCGKIYDFAVDLGGNIPADLKGFRIHSKNVYYRGICRKCLGQNQ